MTSKLDLIDIERYVGERVRTRPSGDGFLSFSCPLCNDNRERGWIGLDHWAVGCYNAGCEANERLDGGVIEWVRLLEGFASRGQAWTHLHANYPYVGPLHPVPSRPKIGEAFCRLPVSTLLPAGSALASEASIWAQGKWGITEFDVRFWGLRVCLLGRYAYRIIIPIIQGKVLRSFQARTYREGYPRYLTARDGPSTDPGADCGTPIGSLLYNIDAVTPGDDVILVEGPGDVMGGAPRFPDKIFVGLLGQSLTPERLLLLVAVRPRRVVVSLDAGVDELRRAQNHAADLRAWGLDAMVGTWVGGKDPGEGAMLCETGDQGFQGMIRSRMEPQPRPTRPTGRPGSP